MHIINGDKAHMLPESSKLWRLDAEMLSGVWEESGGAALTAVQGAHCLYNGFPQNKP